MSTVLFNETMDTILTTPWTNVIPSSYTNYNSGSSQANCPNGDYCWSLTADTSNFAQIYTVPTITSGYGSISLIYSINTLNLAQGRRCKIYYSVDSVPTWNVIAAYKNSPAPNTNILYDISLNNIAADNNPIGIGIMFELSSNTLGDSCWISDIILNGIEISPTTSPTTAIPTINPTPNPTPIPTLNPTLNPTTPIPTTSEPTGNPTTAIPTSMPITSIPTLMPITSIPTTNPITSMPITNIPTSTLNPTTSTPTSSTATSSTSTTTTTTLTQTDENGDEQNSDSNNDSTTNIIIGVVIGLVVIALVIVGFIYFKKKRAAKQMEMMFGKETVDNPNDNNNNDIADDGVINVTQIQPIPAVNDIPPPPAPDPQQQQQQQSHVQQSYVHQSYVQQPQQQSHVQQSYVQQPQQQVQQPQQIQQNQMTKEEIDDWNTHSYKKPGDYLGGMGMMQPQADQMEMEMVPSNNISAFDQYQAEQWEKINDPASGQDYWCHKHKKIKTLTMPDIVQKVFGDQYAQNDYDQYPQNTDDQYDQNGGDQYDQNNDGQYDQNTDQYAQNTGDQFDDDQNNDDQYNQNDVQNDSDSSDENLEFDQNY